MKTSLFFAESILLISLVGCAATGPAPGSGDAEPVAPQAAAEPEEETPEADPPEAEAADPDTPEAAKPLDMKNFLEAEAFEAGFDPRVGSYLMLLRTVGSRGAGVVVPIFVGDREAQTLRMKLQGELSMRPMTHDLTVAFVGKLNARIEYAAIEAMQEGVFLARIFFRDADGNLLSLDSRASDAIILAVTAGRKIYIHRDVVKAAGLQQEGAEESISA